MLDLSLIISMKFYKVILQVCCSGEDLIMTGTARLVEKEWILHPSGNRVMVKLQPIQMGGWEVNSVLLPYEAMHSRINGMIEGSWLHFKGVVMGVMEQRVILKIFYIESMVFNF